MNKEQSESSESNGNQATIHEFVTGDLVWGPTKGSPAWPGKIVDIENDVASVKWFGNEKNVSKIKIEFLQTLTEGLDAQHHARKKARTSRKLNTNLEKAIQEAMAELDKNQEEDTKELLKQKVSSTNIKKASSRLRSGQR